MADLSIEEANKIRVSMGMAPLPVPGAAASSGPSYQAKKAVDDNSDDEPASTVETRQAAAGDNWQKLQDDQAAAKKKADRLAAIKKEREKASRFAKLEGKGLADIDDEDDMAWLKGSKKRAKKLAKAEQMQAELEERERQAREAMQYTESDLAGVKVAHEVDQFEDGEDQILVLKDTAVDAEDDDDELEAVALKEKEKLQEKLDSKKRKRVYDPNDDGQASILAQYDEEIEGKKRKAFTLDGQGRTVEDVQAEKAGVAKPKRVAISLDILTEDKPTNDYMDISEVKMKKPKKKKKVKSSKRQRVEDEDDIFAAAEEPADEMDVDHGTAVAAVPRKRKLMEDQSFIDDDDLQATLAKQRREALKKRKKMRSEDLARQLREEATSAPHTPDIIDSTETFEPTVEDDGTLVIDETTEFVHNLGINVDDEGETRRRQRRPSNHVLNGTAASPDEEVDEEGDVDMGYAEAAEAEERNYRARSTGITGTGLEEEHTMDGGMGAALALLKQRGMVSSSSDSGDKNALFRERQKLLTDIQRAEESGERLQKERRERERNSTWWKNMTPREREEWSRKNNVQADHAESRKLADIFNKSYKPNIDLNYVDEHGRHLNQKEAFKMLSHQFHGKGSGNTKTTKQLEKIAAEKRKMQESSLDTTTRGGLNNAQEHQAKTKKAAGIRMQ